MNSIALRVSACLLSLLLFASCTEFSEQETTFSNKTATKQFLSTKSISDFKDTGIEKKDIEKYLFVRRNVSPESIDSIVRYDIDDIAYVYIVYLANSHWYLMSGDRYSIPIIAEGDGGFNLDFESDPSHHLERWFQNIREMIVENRTSTSRQVTRFHKEWIDIIEGDNYQQSIMNRSVLIDTTETQSIITLDTLIYQYYPGLTVTQWDENYPFNEALPLYLPNYHCAAGCAVVALAQLLYYTHFAFGYPNDTFESATCSQYYNSSGTPPYTYNFSTPSTTCWNQMGLTVEQNYNTTYVAALYAFVAHRSSTVYVLQDGEGVGSTTKPNAIAAMNQFLLTGVQDTTYSLSLARNEIQNDRPVLTTGGSTPYGTIGHTYLLDGYQWLKTRSTEVVMDMTGIVLESNTYIDESFAWHINTGESTGAHLLWDYSNTYYPYYREIFIGWQ